METTTASTRSTTGTTFSPVTNDVTTVTTPRTRTRKPKPKGKRKLYTRTDTLHNYVYIRS